MTTNIKLLQYALKLSNKIESEGETIDYNPGDLSGLTNEEKLIEFIEHLEERWRFINSADYLISKAIYLSNRTSSNRLVYL
jgi:hypothetical protein